MAAQATASRLPSPPSHSPSPSLLPNREPAGNGHLHLSNPHHARFSALRASYPLKLLAPNSLPSQPPHVALAYSLAYGGGLVAGDRVQLSITVDAGCGLVLLTQGSTKVYKHRMGLRPQSHLLRPTDTDQPAKDGKNGEAPLTRQRMHVAVAPGAFLLLMPDTVSPFRDSRYAQAQRIVLAEGSSALILDWVNSGRGHRPPMPTRYVVSKDTTDDAIKSGATAPDEEVWAMAYYGSTNEVVVNGAVVARERMVLDNAGHATDKTGSGLSPVALRLAPYHIYATVLAYGPHLAPLRALLDKVVDGTFQFQLPRPPGLIWSYSALSDDGGILRVTGLEVEDVRSWLRAVLQAGGVADLVREGLWPRCI